MRKRTLWAAIIAVAMLTGCGNQTTSLAPLPSTSATSSVMASSAKAESVTEAPESKPDSSITVSEVQDTSSKETESSQKATATPKPTKAPESTATDAKEPTSAAKDEPEFMGVDQSYFDQFKDLPRNDTGAFALAAGRRNLYVRCEGQDPAMDEQYFNLGREKANEALRLMFDIGPDTRDYTDKILSMTGGYMTPNKEYNIFSTIQKLYDEVHPDGELEILQIDAIKNPAWDKDDIMLAVACILPCEIVKDGKKEKTNLLCDSIAVYVKPHGAWIVDFGSELIMMSPHIEVRFVSIPSEDKYYRWCSDNGPIFDKITFPDFDPSAVQ